MSRLNNKPLLTVRRKRLRNNGTPAEAYFWLFLKKRQVEGRKFRRQFSVGKYIVDFYCPSERLAIELDGQHHFTDPEAVTYDQKRTLYLQNQGITVIRFSNSEIFQHTDVVLELIKKQFR
jgi:very-short-patch-repair endonuclease